VAELRARGSPFWLAFTPLSPDASAAAMREVVAEIRAAVPPGEDRWEVFAALLVMADVDPWGHTLRQEIEAMIQQEPTDLIQVSKTLRDAYERGQREGLEQGIEEGVQQMLRRLFARRLHRALTAREQEALAARATTDPEQVQDKALALEGDALAAWLIGAD
jgi:flagellar biosynthesis/type III secretory pathway protein FliH